MTNDYISDDIIGLKRKQATYFPFNNHKCKVKLKNQMKIKF